MKKKKLIKELTLMLDVINSTIVLGIYPKYGSECHKKIIKLLSKAGRKPTARGLNNE